jgi:peptidyl-prolyl cis-trans isomerase SurA
MPILIRKIPLIVAATIALNSQAAAAPAKAPAGTSAEILIDAVIASVDEKPITLNEVRERLPTPRKITLSELATDREAQEALEAIIGERVLEAEASTKRVSVDDAEIEDYINEVAARNSLSRPDFEAVLKREGKSINWYRRQVKNEITKTKLASSIAKGGISVSDQEIDDYLSASTSLTSDEASLKLRVITVSKAGRTQDDLDARVKSIRAALELGRSFESVAKDFSDDPNKEEGGLLGTVAEKDLSGHISEAVASVEAGKYSEPVVTDSGVQLFFVEQRFAAKSDDDDDDSEERQKARREEARKVIQDRKTKEKLSSYFGSEIQKNHTVDKKF